MGRGKLPLKLIENQRQRTITYRKRLQGIKKKTFELATLCDVPAIMICFDPSSGKVETWPENVREFRNIIEMYNGLSTEAEDHNEVNRFGFLHSRLRKQQLHLSRKRGCFGDNSSVLHPNNRSPEASMEFLDSKLGMIRQRIQLLRNQTCLQSKGDAKGLECFKGDMAISLEQCKQDSVVYNPSEAILAVDPIDWNQSFSLGCSGAPFDFDMCADACAFGELKEYVEFDDFINPYVEQQPDFALPAFDVIGLPPLSFKSSYELQTSFGAHTTESSSVSLDSSQLATAGNEEQFCSSEFGASAVHYQMLVAENPSGMFDSKQFARAGVEEQFCASEFGFGGVHCQIPQAESSINISDEYNLMLTSSCYDQANYDRSMQAAMDDLTYGPLRLWD